MGTYTRLALSSCSEEISLFAQFKLNEIEIEKMANVCTSQGDIALFGLKRCAACYRATIDYLGSSYDPNSEIAIQYQHVKMSLIKWQLSCGELTFDQARNQYDEIFQFCLRAYGNESELVSFTNPCLKFQ